MEIMLDANSNNDNIMNSNTTSKKDKKKETIKLKFIIEEDYPDTEEIITVATNKGTGAGGANTNITGLSYEDKTNLEPLFSEIKYDKKTGAKTVKFDNYEKELINVNKSKLYKFMKQIKEKNNDLKKAAGCKEPDEAYIDIERKIIFIIEKKFQHTNGSVDEKIQTGPFKKLHYSQQFPNFTITYIYCLSDWFKQDEYISVLDYLEQNNIPVFWGNNQNYKNDIIKFMYK